MFRNAAIVVSLAAGALLAGCDNQNRQQAGEQAQDAVAAAQKQAEEAILQAQESLQETEQELREMVARYQVAGQLEEDVPQRAVAILHPTEGNDVSGTVTFVPVEEGLEVSAEVSGLSSGEHGYHIHIYGDCTSADGKSAGTHFHLEGSSLNPPKDIGYITGNLGNLSAGQDGTAEHEGLVENAELVGPKSIIGRSVVVHAQPNDPNKPPIGGAGARQACGVIGIANPKD